MQVIDRESNEEQRLSGIYGRMRSKSMNLTDIQLHHLITSWLADRNEVGAIGPNFSMALALLQGHENVTVTDIDDIHDQNFKEAAVRDYILLCNRIIFNREVAQIKQLIGI
jgi:hypothetical protein